MKPGPNHPWRNNLLFKGAKTSDIKDYEYVKGELSMLRATKKLPYLTLAVRPESQNHKR